MLAKEIIDVQPAVPERWVECLLKCVLSRCIFRSDLKYNSYYRFLYLEYNSQYRFAYAMAFLYRELQQSQVSRVDGWYHRGPCVVKQVRNGRLLSFELHFVNTYNLYYSRVPNSRTYQNRTLGRNWRKSNSRTPVLLHTATNIKTHGTFSTALIVKRVWLLL